MSLTIKQQQLLEQSLDSIKGHMILMVKATTQFNAAHRLDDPELIDSTYNKLQDHLGNAKNALQRFDKKL